jgi:hypothetical protein
MALQLDKILAALQGGFQPIGPGSAGRRAAVETQLRYLPALQALGLLGRQTNQAFRQEAQGVRRGGAAAAGAIGGIRTGLDQQLSATPAPTSEAAAALGLTRDAVLGDLAQMQAQQVAGVPSQVQTLRSKRNSDLSEIVQQMFQKADEASLYNVGQFEALGQQNRENRRAQRQWQAEMDQARRESKQAWKQFQQGQETSLLTAGINPATGQWDPALNPPEQTGPSPKERRERREERRETNTGVRDDIQRIADRYKTLATTTFYRNDEGELSLEPKDGFEPFQLPPNLIRQRLETKYGDKVPPLVFNAGLEMGRNNALDRGTLQALKRRYPKFGVPQGWREGPGNPFSPFG